MDAIITVIRIPFGLLGSIIVLSWWILLFPFETFFVIFCLPFGVIFMTRSSFKNSWICSWPNSLNRIGPNFASIWEWVFND